MKIRELYNMLKIIVSYNLVFMAKPGNLRRTIAIEYRLWHTFVLMIRSRNIKVPFETNTICCVVSNNLTTKNIHYHEYWRCNWKEKYTNLTICDYGSGPRKGVTCWINVRFLVVTQNQVEARSWWKYMKIMNYS